jgi:hypothetical protein
VLWVQRREPVSFERVDELAHRPLLGGEIYRDLWRRPALHRRQDDPGSAQRHPISTCPGDPHQPLRLVASRSRRNLWPSRHPTPPSGVSLKHPSGIAKTNTR